MSLQTLIAVSLAGVTINLAAAAELPIPCGTGTCGPSGPTSWVTSGQASATVTANSFTINQTTDRLLLNWQQFNIGPDGQVTFRQPDSTSVALNKIFQGDPVRILGTLQANGSVYLINQNGILFGPNARVDVGGLIASTLDLTPDAVNGLLEPAKKRAPAFQAFVDTAGNPASGNVRVESGAQLTAEGGQLFLLGSNVTNAGNLSAPGGQVIIAAGDSVYLAGSPDANLRGLLVEVGNGGVATNFASGVVSAPRGNVTLVGLMVNQEGRASATTSVRENGSVRLLARDGGQILANGAGTSANRGGTLRLGSGSLTTVGFEHNDDDKTVDATPQARSFVELEGRTVALESRSQVIAPSGTVQITAREDGTQVSDFAAAPGQGRVVVAADARIDVSGAQIDRSVDANILRVELRGSQLADSPEQRDGPLRGQTANVDIRRSGTRADGTVWVGSPIGDLAGDVATIQKTVEERSLLGGQVQIAATGAVVLETGSTVDISGGGINFTGGLVNTTQVLGTDGRVYDIGVADRDRSYAGLTDAITVVHKKWGVTETFKTFWPSQGAYEPGYYEGKDAGTVSIAAPRAALDGAIRGEAIAGLHQRATPTNVPANVLYRNVSELPVSGRLVLGTANPTGGGGFLISGVQVASGPVLADLAGPTGAPFNPLLDPLPDELATVRVKPELFGADRLGALTVYANGNVTLGSSSVLDLGNAGQLAVTAGSVDIRGRVVAPGASVSLTAQPSIASEPGQGKVALGPAASIDVAGVWVNDAPSPGGVTEHDPLVINGGSVSLSAKGGAGLELLAGSRIDVSAGANRQANGTIAVGRGGSIAISAAPFPGGKPQPITFESQLSAYAFSQGGRLSLTMNSFCLADGDCSGPATGQYRDETGTHAIDGLHVDLATFASEGFETVSLASNLGGIDVAPGTRLQPREHNYLWAIEPTRAPSGAALSSLATIGVLPDLYRRPFNLSLSARPQVGDGGAILNADYPLLGFLRVGTDAVLDFDVRASLMLRSSTGIVVDGTLSAPAGTIVLDVTSDLQLQEFVPNQGIWLGDRTRLNVAGVVQTLPDDFGLLRGAVLDGGSITLRAERGYVATAQKSVLDASGTSADLVVGQTAAGSAGRVSRVASAGGSIEIAAAEGLVLSGAVYAPAGQGSTAAGGSLRVTLDGNLHGSAASPGPIYPFAPRELHVFGGEAPVVIAPGQPLPVELYGHGLLPVERVAGGGFSSVELDAMNLFDPKSGSSAPVSTGSIQFDGSMTLQAAANLRLNAPRLVGTPGSEVSLSAAYVGLGYDDIAYQAQTGGSASPGSSALTVNGGLIDLIGTLGLDGFGSTKLASRSDIRLRGVEPTSEFSSALPLAGLLHSQGAVDLLAQQVYASTLTDYHVLLDGPDHTLISLHTSPGTPGPVLSAGGRITLTANEISQGGVLRAPLGEIVLQAQDVTLADGSLTSTSASGALIPFGTLQVGADWTYQLPRGQTALYTTSGPPAQRLELNAQNVTVAPGATIDLSGGGNLVGYEFVPGVSGTKDVLANDFVVGQFAIVPALGLTFAPVDPAAQVGFGYQPGETVYLAGYGDLPAGEYAILPARYALLPGAYLVRPVTGYTDIRADETVERLDGGIVISGARGTTGTALRDSRTSGFAVYSGEQIARRARYDLTLADDFFSSRAAAENTAAPRVTRDAGQLQLIAAAHLDLEGLLNASVGTGGRGSRVDVSASRLRVVADSATGGDAGEVSISASQLDALGSESLLLGGLRTTTQTGTQIDTTAERLTVDGGVTLDAPTLTLVARNQLEIQSGATLQASGTVAAAARALTLSGDGALVRVSTAELGEVTRTGATGAGGNLLIGKDAVISSSGSALIEASGTVDAKAAFDLAGGSLGFSVTRLGFGDVDSTYTGLALSAKDLSSLNLRELSLTSATDIDFFRTAPIATTDDGSTTLRVNGVLALTAQSLNVHDAPMATIGADRLVLAGKGSAAPVAGNGKLVLDAKELAWGGGSLGTSGVNSVTLTATNQFRAEQSGALNSAGDVKLQTPEVLTGNGTDFAIRASGALDVLGTGQASTATAAAPAGVGGSLLLEGSRVTLGARLTLPSGLVKVRADAADVAGMPSISLTDSATLDVSGFKVLFDGEVASGDGGLVRMESALGGVSLAAGSVVDVSAGTGQGNAGRLDLRAPSGAIALSGGLRGSGVAGSGEIEVDGASIPDLGFLNRKLNGAGFERSRVFHQRGPGDLVVAGGVASIVRATNVDIAADGGSVIVLGDVDASGANGGAIKLAARDNVDVSGSLRADSSASAAEGGRVDLWTDAGGIFLRDGARVSVAAGGGGVGGLVNLRAPRQSLLSVLDADASNDVVSLGGQISGNRELDIEGYQRYTVANGVIDASYTGAVASNPLHADASAFMQSADPLAAALVQGATPTVVNAGIELQSTHGLTLAADWNLATWRFNGQPGVLTLRAGGDLFLQKSLSDGFSAITGTGAFEIPDVATRSWSYRLVAGADLNSSDVLALKTAGTNLGAGKLVVAGGGVSAGTAAPVPIMVRTGTGNIDIATAADFVLTNRASVIYTAGANSGLGVPLPVLGAALRKYPTDGGDISMSIGGDIVGAPTNQLITGWLWRTGRRAGLAFPQATGWNVNFQRFEQGVGALAGGNVSVRADGNIRDFSASVATIGRQVGGTTAATSVVQETGGGTLVVESGGDLTGGSYYDGKGTASVRSWGGIGINTAPGAASALAPTLALGDTVMNVTARRDLTLEAVVNPFLLPQVPGQTGLSSISYFSTYSARSALHTLSTGGDTKLINSLTRPGGLSAALSSSLAPNRATGGFAEAPSTLDMVTLAGDISMGGPVNMWPSPSGDLRVFVNGDLNLAFPLALPDVDPATLPTVASPADVLTSLGSANKPVPGVSRVPIHSAAFRPDGQDDPEPVRVVATGDIVGAQFAYVAKPLRLISGGDITDLYANIENLNDSSLSLISARGNIVYRTPRHPLFGYIMDNTIGIQVEGPGQLALQAGGSVDLGSSFGVTSVGNFLNPALPANGADISLLAGVAAGGARLDAFEQHYLAEGTLYDELLARFVQSRGAPAGATKATYLATLRQMTADARYQLAQAILFKEVRAGGRAAAAPGPGHDDYTRAFAALETLFPGSTAPEEAGSAYAGDISLFFSRAYTLDGGNISFVAPGGEVNVGLATPPAAFGVSKPASSLGIVAQRKGDISSISYGDFQVNESRVFAADGGDILVWSTQGDIDAGRGAKTAIAAPPPTITFNSAGNPVAIFPAALTGSGIQALSTSEGTNAGSVDLFAPRGVVNAGDAGIVAGNLTIGATAVLGADNISVSGVSVGVPVDTGGFGAALTGASSVAAGATNAADDTVAQSRQEQTSATPLADQALGFLDVFVTGFGEPCDPTKEDCRNKDEQ